MFGNVLELLEWLYSSNCNMKKNTHTHTHFFRFVSRAIFCCSTALPSILIRIVLFVSFCLLFDCVSILLLWGVSQFRSPFVLDRKRNCIPFRIIFLEWNSELPSICNGYSASAALKIVHMECENDSDEPVSNSQNHTRDRMKNHDRWALYFGLRLTWFVTIDAHLWKPSSTQKRV